MSESVDTYAALVGLPDGTGLVCASGAVAQVCAGPWETRGRRIAVLRHGVAYSWPIWWLGQDEGIGGYDYGVLPARVVYIPHRDDPGDGGY